MIVAVCTITSTVKEFSSFVSTTSIKKPKTNIILGEVNSRQCSKLFVRVVCLTIPTSFNYTCVLRQRFGEKGF